MLRAQTPQQVVVAEVLLHVDAPGEHAEGNVRGVGELRRERLAQLSRRQQSTVNCLCTSALFTVQVLGLSTVSVVSRKQVFARASISRIWLNREKTMLAEILCFTLR